MAGISYPSLCVGVHILDGESYSKTRSKVLWQVLLVETQARKRGLWWKKEGSSESDRYASSSSASRSLVDD